MTATARAPALVDTRICGRAGARTHAAEEGPAQPEEPISRSERARRARYLRKLEEARAEEERAKTLPAYINACFNNPNRHRTYWVYTWKPEDPSTKKRIPYTCGSWKCQHCREHAGHVLYARLQQAFHGLDSSAVVFVVLTLDTPSHKRAAYDLDALYREFSQRQNRWMKRLRRWLVQEYGYDMGNRWASVTECHKSGVPHVNIAIHHPGWSEDLRKTRAGLLESGIADFDAIKLWPALAQHAQDCGFGWRCSAEANRYGHTEAITGYLVKGVKNADAMHAELSKLCQVPTMAPKNFRRLRAGKGFVPPKEKSDSTGTVIRRYWTPEGDEQTEPLSTSRVKPPEEWDTTARWIAEHPDSELPSDLLNAWEDYRDRVHAYNAEVEHCRAIEQVCAWEAEGFRGPTVVEDGAREELIQSYTRRLDGATVRAGLVVLNAPRSPGDRHDQQARQESQRDNRDDRGGGSRDGPDRCGAASPGGPADGGDRQCSLFAATVRVSEAADPFGREPRNPRGGDDSAGRDGRVWH